jgi:hypothetical protein
MNCSNCRNSSRFELGHTTEGVIKASLGTDFAAKCQPAWWQCAWDSFCQSEHRCSCGRGGTGHRRWPCAQGFLLPRTLFLGCRSARSHKPGMRRERSGTVWKCCPGHRCCRFRGTRECFAQENAAVAAVVLQLHPRWLATCSKAWGHRCCSRPLALGRRRSDIGDDAVARGGGGAVGSAESVAVCTCKTTDQSADEATGSVGT